MTTPSLNAAASAASPAAASVAHSLLRLSVAGEVLAVPIDDVHEILKVRTMTPLPRTPAFVRGVMNLRGRVVPVIDLAARFGHESAVVGPRTCIVVVEAAGLPAGTDGAPVPPLVAGLLVDSVFEVFDVAAGQVEAVPVMGTRVPGTFLQGMTRTRGAVVAVLALARVLDRTDLAALIASHDDSVAAAIDSAVATSH